MRITFYLYVSVTLLIIFAPQKSYASLEELSYELNSPGKITNKTNIPRQIVIESIKSDQYREGIKILSDYTVKTFKTPSRVLLSQKIKILAIFTDGATCIEKLLPRNKYRATTIKNDVLEWLFNSNNRMNTLAETFSIDDNMPEVIKIIDTLYRHDPAGRDKFFNLIVAMAVVWDQKRPRMHGQIGPNILQYTADITNRYTFFKKQYSTGNGKILYKELDVQSLCFVVDTPVPVSELDWAIENVKGSRSNWDRKYSKIKYNHIRIDYGIYVWPHAEYSLAAIEEFGGICVDQAYYAVITARAHGIPALYFSGPGRRGGHAWFAYKKGKTSWKLDCSRYTYDKYATGNSINPQTNRKMTDHDVDYTCDHSLRSRLYQTASCYTRIANILIKYNELSAARSCTKEARKLSKKYETPWNLEILTWLKESNKSMAIKILEEKAKVFSKYPDISTKARKLEAKLLQETGKYAEAEKVLRLQTKRVMQDRDDLANEIVAHTIACIINSGNNNKARKDMEKLLIEQKKEGAKVFPLIYDYLKLTEMTGQTHEAAKFIRNYTRNLLMIYPPTPNNKRIIFNLLLKAYENDNDEKSIKKTKRDIARIK